MTGSFTSMEEKSRHIYICAHLLSTNSTHVGCSKVFKSQQGSLVWRTRCCFGPFLVLVITTLDTTALEIDQRRLLLLVGPRHWGDSFGKMRGHDHGTDFKAREEH